MSVKHLLYELLWSGSRSVRSNFWGGRKPFPKPSAFESEIHPTHKPSVYAPGISPLQGANLRRRKFTVRQNRTVFIHAAQRTGAWMLLLLTATFWDKYTATSTGLRRSPFAAVRKQQP